MGNLRRIAQPTRDGAPSLVFECVKRVRPAPHFRAVFEDTLNELFGDGATPDLFEVVDLGKELATTGVELGGGG